MRTKINENSFAGQSFFVGIDCHKKSWKVTIVSENYEHKTMSQNPDPDVLANYLKRNFPGGNYNAVYEAGFSGFNACRRLRELGVHCTVIHPADVPTNQKERLQKTDKVDSRKLARSLKSGECKGVHIPERSLEADRALIRQRARLVKDISRTKNRIKSLLLQFGIEIPEKFTNYQTRHWSKVFINWLKELPIQEASLKQTLNNYIRIGEILRKELLTVNAQVRKLSQSPGYKDDYKLLKGIPGIGVISAMTILVEFGNISRFNNMKELSDYIGLVPTMHNSGDRMDTGEMISRGKTFLKIILIEASWQAIRQDPALMLKFNELNKTMNKNKAIIRIARKMLSRIRYVLKNKQKYEFGVVK